MVAVARCRSPLIGLGRLRTAQSQPGSDHRGTPACASLTGVPPVGLPEPQPTTVSHDGSAPTDKARVCLAAPPPASPTLPVPSTRASHDGRHMMTVAEPSAQVINTPGAMESNERFITHESIDSK